MWTIDERMAAVAAGQHGVVTRPQLLSLGLSASAISRRVRARVLRPVRAGVYLVGGAPDTEEATLLAACLAIGPAAVASHRSAAWLWRFAGVAPPEVPEVTNIGSHSPKARGILVHRAVVADAGDITVHRGVPVTKPAPTLIHLAGVLSPYVVETAFNDARRRRLCSVDDVRRCFRRYDTFRGKAVIATLIDAHGEGDERADSDLELAAQRALRRAGLPEPVKQQPVLTARGLYHIDLAYPAEQVGIELLGFDHHGTRLAFDRDPIRRNALLNAGWHLLEFTSRTPVGVFVEQVTTGRARGRAV